MSNKYRSQNNHTEIKYTPLFVTCNLVCVTPQSPVTQNSNSLLNEFEPNREGLAGTPCVILPSVRIIDKDGVFPNGSGNAYLDLGSIVWKVNNVDISTLSDWTGKYEIIQTADENRGALKIERNVLPTEKIALTFTGKFTDWRTNTVWIVSSSNQIVLTTTDKGDNIFGMSVDAPNIGYDPLQDPLLLYDYLIGKGVTLTGARADRITGKAFERVFACTLTNGTDKLTAIPAGYTWGLYYKGGTTSLVANDVNSPEVMDITFPAVKLDLRMIDTQEYELRLTKDGNTIVSAAISIVRKMQPVVSATPINGADIIKGTEEYFNDALISLADQSVNYPELYYLIEWYTQARIYDQTSQQWKTADEVKRNWGQSMRCDVNDIGLGQTSHDSCFDVGFDVTEKGADTLLTDESGNVLTDENGNFLIAA